MSRAGSTQMSSGYSVAYLQCSPRTARVSIAFVQRLVSCGSSPTEWCENYSRKCTLNKKQTAILRRRLAFLFVSTVMGMSLRILQSRGRRLRALKLIYRTIPSIARCLGVTRPPSDSLFSRFERFAQIRRKGWREEKVSELSWKFHSVIRFTFSARRNQRFCPPRWRRMPVLILTMCLTIVTAAESAPQQVTGKFGREVTLPCQGTATHGRVYWQKSEPLSTREKVVNARCLPSEPCLELVDPSYANRSEILANSTTGNFSLLLRDLVVADEGVYKCILQSNGVISQRMVNLSIEAEYSQPEVRQLPLDGVWTGNTVNLTCTSSGGYPLATLHWVKGSTGEALGKGQNLTSYSQDRWRMYQLYSKLQLPVDHDPISCLLRTRRGKVLPSAQISAASERLYSLGWTDTIHGVSGGQPGFGQLSPTVVIIISVLAWIGPQTRW